MPVTRIKNNQITDATIVASAKLVDYSITSGKIANDLTYGSNLTVTGNLTVNGTTTTIDTYDLVVEDPLILLAKNQTGSPTLDIGFIGKRGDQDNIAFVWDESADQFVAVFTTSEVTNTTISINSYASMQVLDITASNANITGNLTFSGNIIGSFGITGNLTANNISSNNAIDAVTITASGNLNGGNAVITNDVSATTGSFSGNVLGGNLNSNAEVTGVTITASGNLVGGNVNITEAVNSNTVSANSITATGNITGGNLLTSGSGGDIILSGGNITGANVISSNTVSAITGSFTGNVLAGNLNSNAEVTGVTITASGNLVGNNAVISNNISTATLETTGNALIGGNLIVQGNITYINIDDLRVEDPIIILGTGPNGAPLTVDDGLDRGIFMEYYTTGLGNAFMGWDNSSGNMVIANDAYFTANDVVGINSYGTLEVGNIYAESASVVGNVTANGITANDSLTVGGGIVGVNVQGSTGSITASGNIAAGNISTGGNIDVTGQVSAATGYFTGNVDVLGNLNATIGVVYANSGIFYGNSVTGNNAAFAGIPGFTQLGSNVVMQFAGNVNSYSQINFQNINSGNLASTDYIATADNGDDSNYYVNMGINSSTFDDPASYPGYFPNDAYLHNHGGNLILNPETTGKTIQFMVGGTDTTDVIGTVSATGLAVTGNVTATTAGVFGNLTLQGDDITSDTGEVSVNTAGADVNFRVAGDTDANLFITDAGTDTVLIGTATPTTDAKLVIDSTDSMLIPVGNSLQRPATGVTGMLRFNTTTNSLEFYDADSWESAGTTFTIVVSDQFTGDGSTVAFTLSQDSTTAATIVAINGVVQIPTTAYSISGNVLTFTEAPISTDVIDARILTTTTTVTALQNAVGNAVIEASETSQAFSVTGSLIPTANVTFDLGSNSSRWRDGYFAGNSITLGNIVMKNTGGNSIGFFGPDGTTPATLDANVSVVGDAIESGTSNVSFAGGGGNVLLVAGGNTTGVITATGANITGTLNATGNITGANLSVGSGIIVTTGNINGANVNATSGITAGTTVVATGNVAGGNITTAGQVVATGNITGGNLSGTSIVGTLTTASQTNITAVGTLGSLSVTGNVAGGNITTAGQVVATGNISAGNLNVNTGNVVLNTGALIVGVGGIVNSNANGVGNIGSATGYFNTVFAKATSAQYADLAEMYEGDASYTPGTVVCFGGAKEVTVCNTPDCTRVAGVVSTNPSYIMNANQSGEHVVAVALTGRVPCRVTGVVRKGDLMVSAGNGVAKADNNPRVGSIIGKALADFDGAEGVIEVVVGRF